MVWKIRAWYPRAGTSLSAQVTRRIPVAHTQNDSETVEGSQEAFEKMLHERLRQAVRVALISVLEEEVTAFIGALPYERTQQRRDQRNGHYRRDLETTMGQIADLPVPRTRGGYHTQVFERYHRRRDDLDTAIGQMFVDGVSMAKVGQVVETLTGSKPSASTVSRVFHTLESEYREWKQRPLEKRYAYAFADGTYFTVIYNDEGCKMPILAVVAITETEKGKCWRFGSEIGKMSRPGKTSSRISKHEASKRSAYGSVMATRPCWVRSLPHLGPLQDSAVWCIRWTMCSATSLPSSRNKSNRSYEPCSIRRIESPLIRLWRLLSKSIKRSTPRRLSACSAIWRRVYLLCFPEGALENHSYQQCHGATLRGSQATFAQNGCCFPE